MTYFKDKKFHLSKDQFSKFAKKKPKKIETARKKKNAF